MKISIISTMTNPEKRMDPWKESLNFYNDFADEVIITGEDWKEEFSWEYIGETYQEAFDKTTGDWVLSMALDMFIHESYKNKLRESLEKFKEFPAVSFPKYQFFVPTKYHLKSRLVVAYNKKMHPNLNVRGGSDLCIPNIGKKVLNYKNVPAVNIPIFQYESMFRTKDVIQHDRARFARAWNRCFGNFGDRGGPTEKEAFDAWINDITKKIKLHTHDFKVENHPKYIIEKIENITENMFGKSAFGLDSNKRKNYHTHLKNIVEKELNQRYLCSDFRNYKLNSFVN